jgi:hypothetical protein
VAVETLVSGDKNEYITGIGSVAGISTVATLSQEERMIRSMKVKSVFFIVCFLKFNVP